MENSFLRKAVLTGFTQYISAYFLCKYFHDAFAIDE